MNTEIDRQARTIAEAKATFETVTGYPVCVGYSHGPDSTGRLVASVTCWVPAGPNTIERRTYGVHCHPAAEGTKDAALAMKRFLRQNAVSHPAPSVWSAHGDWRYRMESDIHAQRVASNAVRSRVE